MRLESVGIPGEGITLSALRYLPGKATRDTELIYAHGFTAGKYSLDNLAAYLAGKGYPGLTFDLIGHKLGASGGNMLSAEQAVANVRDVLQWLRQRSTARQIVLIGHSMGGVAVLAAAVESEARQQGPARLAGIVCLCVGLEASRGFDGVIGRAMLAQRSDYVEGAPALQLLKELDTLVLRASNLGDLPALFIAARQDVLVPPERIAALAALAGPYASVETLDASHQDAPDRARASIARWLEERSSPGL